MRLSEALRINEQPVAPGGQTRTLHLLAGFTPLHLETMLKAQARLQFPGDRIEIVCGLFGDLEGNLKRAAQKNAEGALVAVEWSDLDERLGMRASAGWSETVLADVLQQVPEKMRRLTAGLSEIAKSMPVAVIAPTLPLPPLTHFPIHQTSIFELQLRCALASFMNQIAGLRGVRLVSESALNLQSRHGGRYDPQMDLHTGFPYTLSHAAAIANLWLECLFPRVPKKGLITDLDDSLWKGIVGDAGAEGVSWSLEDRSQGHAWYQQLLASLADSGTLIAIASKNDPAVVRRALSRSDILVKEEQVFPIEVSWGAKSEAIARILSAWNISAGNVVFVDDSLMELAEVKEKFPAIECLAFPSRNPAEILELLNQLRARFGKSEVREEDRLRLHSLRSAAVAEAYSPEVASSDFLSRLGAEIMSEYSTSPADVRAFELVNKTNQFNLNGRRFTDGEWRNFFQQPGAFLLSVSYRDRFGPLGKIAVLGGRLLEGAIHVGLWVMSCRAFSRQIEFQVLHGLFEKYQVGELRFSLKPTARNGPLIDFFTRFFSGNLNDGDLTLPLDRFRAGCPPLSHRVIEKEL